MNTEIFDLGKIGITLGHEYDAEVIYEKLTIVLYKGKSYISTKTTKGVSPEQDIKTWQLVAEAKDAYHMLVDAGKTTLTEEEFLEQLVDATKGRYIVQGNVINAADEEDLTVEHSSLLGIDTLKLANRSSTDGMGYVILRKNKSFAEQVTKENTIYEIRYEFDLNGTNITIPNDSILNFNGGSINNGSIVLNNTKLYGNVQLKCLVNGTCSNDTLSPTMFFNGDWCDAIQTAINIISNKGGGTVIIPSGTYNIPTGKKILLKNNINILGYGATLIADIDTRIFTNIEKYGGNGTIDNPILKNVSIEGITIPQCWHAIHINGFENITIKNCTLCTTNDNSLPTEGEAGEYAKVEGGEHRYPFVVFLYNGINAIIENCTINGSTEHEASSNDGIHISGCTENVFITNCNISSGDDSISLNAPENTQGDIKNITINNCHLYGMGGLRIYPSRVPWVKKGKGDVIGVSVINTTIEQAGRNVFCMFITNTAEGGFKEYWEDESGKYYLQGEVQVNFQNCTISALNSIQFPISIAGVSGNIIFNNCKIKSSYYKGWNIGATISGGVSANIEFNNCDFSGDSINLNNPYENYKANVLFKNCYNFAKDVPFINVMRGYFDKISFIDNKDENAPIAFPGDTASYLDTLIIKTPYTGQIQVMNNIKNVDITCIANEAPVDAYVNNIELTGIQTEVTTISVRANKVDDSCSLIRYLDNPLLRIKECFLKTGSNLPNKRNNIVGDTILKDGKAYVFSDSSWALPYDTVNYTLNATDIGKTENGVGILASGSIFIDKVNKKMSCKIVGYVSALPETTANSVIIDYTKISDITGRSLSWFDNTNDTSVKAIKADGTMVSTEGISGYYKFGLGPNGSVAFRNGNNDYASVSITDLKSHDFLIVGNRLEIEMYNIDII